MSGHSKWATIKHQKAATDARRGKLFAKLIRAIEVAARTGGSNVDGNPTLADAIQKAKDASVPNDTIDRAVKRGAGELKGPPPDTVTYEGYAPGGVAVLVETLTDNRNRTTADVRRAFSKASGSMADAGSVAYLFSRKGQLVIPGGAADEDRVMELALEAGAEDIQPGDDGFTVTTSPGDLRAVRPRRRHLRVGRGHHGAEPVRAARPRHRHQGPAPGRRARGVGRRPGRVRQFRHPGCGDRRGDQLDPAATRRRQMRRRPRMNITRAMMASTIRMISSVRTGPPRSSLAT
jgi:YebC/PmpR family DNA-binding regulatory protein